MPRRAKGCRISGVAHRFWENRTLPRRLEEVVDAVFSLPDQFGRTVHVGPHRHPWALQTLVFRTVVRLEGRRDWRGRWTLVTDVQEVRRYDP